MVDQNEKLRKGHPIEANKNKYIVNKKGKKRVHACVCMQLQFRYVWKQKTMKFGF